MVQEMILEEEVIDVICNSSLYEMRTSTGRRISVIQCETFSFPREQGNSQAPAENYAAGLWIRSLQGYFVFRQEFHNYKSGPWLLVKEVAPDGLPGFYDRYFTQLKEGGSLD